jgi:AMP-binding enzyme C-terminal domain
MEIESALVANPLVAEAAVVGKPHEIKGEAVFAFVVCRGQRPAGDTTELVQKLRNWVGEQVGAIAKPDDIRFADNLPKTRSGKIMRRLLRSIARGEEILQDVSTLENPAILDQLRGVDGGAPSGAAAASTPKASARVAKGSGPEVKKSSQAAPRKASKPGASKQASRAGAPTKASKAGAARKASKAGAPKKGSKSTPKKTSKKVSKKAPKRGAALTVSPKRSAAPSKSNAKPRRRSAPKKKR